MYLNPKRNMADQDRTRPSERHLFLSAMEIEDATERDAFLEGACGDDGPLLDRVRHLLDLDRSASRLLGEEDRAEPLSDFEAIRTPREKAGESIGNFMLRECLGEGGYGSVWLAKQNYPVQREVALKILKLGMDTREVLARFDQERQALALMNHPNIARVYDAGTTPAGRPFFAMELIVNGQPLTTFCRQKNLDVEEQLKLFVSACSAVQHAHHKGIIHRDLKPTNVLVSGGDTHQVKVIDFGIAKATGENRLTDHTILTRPDRLVGTPYYMSPEQLAGAADIDTRTDVYSLGILLYELLTGTLPHAEAKQESKDLNEWVQVVRDRPPRKPSTQITKKNQLHSLAPAKSDLVGDLDCIALKALESDPDRRYESPAALAADIERYLKNEPILARPQSPLYLARRFAKRHRTAVISAAAVLLALVMGLTTSSILLLREKAARAAADREMTRSQQVTRILTRTLESAGASYSLGRDPTMLREILEKTADDLDGELSDLPAIEAQLRTIIGRTFDDIDEYEKAIAQHEKSVAIHRRRWDSGDRSDPEAYASALGDYAEAWQSKGRLDLAEETIRKALEIQKRVEWKSPLDGLVAKYEAESLLGWVMFKTGRAAEAEEMMREGFLFWRQHPDIHALAEIPKTYGTLLSRIGKNAEAETVMRTELEKFREIYGPHHPLICNCLSNLSYRLITNGKLAEAEAMLKESVEMGRLLFGDRSPHADHSYGGLADIARKRGDPEAELNYRREAAAAAGRVFPEGHVYRKASANALAKTLFRQASEAIETASVEDARPLLVELETLIDSEAGVQVDLSVLAELRENAGF